MNAVYRLRGRRLLLIALLAALIALLAAAPARAAEVRGGQDVFIGRDQVVAGDLYVAGNTVTVDGTVKGDLVAVANQVIINGVVEGDLLAAGQAIVINGVVRDDVRAGGQAVLLTPSARVDGDLAIGGLSLENQSGSVVRGDLLVGAYQALLAGEIGRNIMGGLDRLELRGPVGGDVDIGVGGGSDPSAAQFSPAGPIPIPRVGPRLTMADSARIGGKLIYRSTAEASINPSAQVGGGVTFDPQPVAPAAQPVAPVLTYIRRFVSLLLVGLLLLWLMPAWSRRLADTVEAKPQPSLGWGLLAFFAFIGAVIAVLVLAIALAILLGWLTLGGLVAMVIFLGMLLDAVLVTGYIAFAAYVAQIVVGFVAARWLLRRVQPAWAERTIVPLVLGVFLYVVLRAIPWLGPIVAIGVVLAGLGALWQWGRATFQRSHPTPAPIVGLQPA
jgi:cytoskeletal protein CcmA (bactofilin family)